MIKIENKIRSEEKKREMNACNSPLYPVEKKLKTCPKNMKFEVKMRRVIDDDFCDQRASIIETQNIPSYT